MNGWILDSCPSFTNPDRGLMLRNIVTALGTSINSHWEEVHCQTQTELECGPRVLWAMLMICSGKIRNKTMEEIILQVSNLGGIERERAAWCIRQEIAEFGGGRVSLMHHKRLW